MNIKEYFTPFLILFIIIIVIIYFKKNSLLEDIFDLKKYLKRLVFKKSVLEPFSLKLDLTDGLPDLSDEDKSSLEKVKEELEGDDLTDTQKSNLLCSYLRKTKNLKTGTNIHIEGNLFSNYVSKDEANDHIDMIKEYVSEKKDKFKMIDFNKSNIFIKGNKLSSYDKKYLLRESMDNVISTTDEKHIFFLLDGNLYYRNGEEGEWIFLKQNIPIKQITVTDNLTLYGIDESGTLYRAAQTINLGVDIDKKTVTWSLFESETPQPKFNFICASADNTYLYGIKKVTKQAVYCAINKTGKYIIETFNPNFGRAIGKGIGTIFGKGDSSNNRDPDYYEYKLGSLKVIKVINEDKSYKHITVNNTGDTAWLITEDVNDNIYKYSINDEGKNYSIKGTLSKIFVTSDESKVYGYNSDGEIYIKETTSDSESETAFISVSIDDIQFDESKSYLTLEGIKFYIPVNLLIKNKIKVGEICLGPKDTTNYFNDDNDKIKKKELDIDKINSGRCLRYDDVGLFKEESQKASIPRFYKKYGDNDWERTEVAYNHDSINTNPNQLCINQLGSFDTKCIDNYHLKLMNGSGLTHLDLNYNGAWSKVGLYDVEYGYGRGGYGPGYDVVQRKHYMPDTAYKNFKGVLSGTSSCKGVGGHTISPASSDNNNHQKFFLTTVIPNPNIKKYAHIHQHGSD